ncbi:MAG TPA: C25 family cysteine peptidase [Phnomibacter sp.]|nr:C25 family cysteine peptidase [Phnomibacter sp.]
MKFLFAILSFWFITTTASGQSFRNEWIDYSKTYYKFPVAYDRLYRISKASLTAIGLGNVPAQDFQLWRNGEEVAIYTTEETGPLAANGYIEFIGKMNDGKPDNELFAKPSDQVNNERSYFSDTAWHYLTVNAGKANKRIKAAANNVVTTPLVADSFFMYRQKHLPTYLWNYGAAPELALQAIRSSLLNEGEGWASPAFNYYYPQNFGLSALQFFPNGPALEYAFSVSGNYSMGGPFSTLNRNIITELNDSLVASTFVAGYAMARDTVRNLSKSIIKNDALAIKMSSTNDYWWDNSYLNTFSLLYPRKFNFGGAYFFEFSLAANSKGNHIRVNGFQTDGLPAIAYDLTSGKRYVATTKSDSSLLLLEPSAVARNIVFANQANTLINVSTFSSVRFKDFVAATQGNFLIITSKAFLQPGSNNAVENYKTYRSSAAGGSHKVVVYDVDDLAEQFAYGIIRHPLSIRNFIRYCNAKFTEKPKHIFLIGRGTQYEQIRGLGYFPGKEELSGVPTFGTPTSDNLLAAADNSSPVPTVPIGRLSAVSNEEVQTYLDKVKMYEALLNDPGKTPENRNWHKEVLQLIGGDDAFLAGQIKNYFNRYTQIVTDTFVSANAITYQRVNNPNFSVDMSKISNGIDSGVGLLTYFGHSSTSGIDFNLNNPEDYHNSNGKYQVMIANGCKAGNIFDLNLSRLQSKAITVSENYIFAKNTGAISFISNSDLGVLQYMHLFTNEFYKSFTRSSYGKSIGTIQQEAIKNAWAVTGASDPVNRSNLEQVVLHSDPAIIPFPYPAADYTTSKESIQFETRPITVAHDSVWVKVKVANIGRAKNDSVDVLIQRETPSGKLITLLSTKIAKLNNQDSVRVKIGFKGMVDAGTNYIIATVDPLNLKTEMTKTNNIGRLAFMLDTAAIVPVFPYDLSIVNNAPVLLTGSTANPAAKPLSYRFQLDTSKNFNSPALVTIDTSTIGGAVNFQPNTSWRNNTVYYWRLSPVSLGIATNWSNASFLYNTAVGTGSNQSHYFQHLQSSFNTMMLNATSRKFEFGNKLQNLYIEHGIYPTSGTENSHFSVMVNGLRNIYSACIGQSIIFNVFDGASFAQWDNSSGGRFGSAYICDYGREYNFEFYYHPHDNRKKIMDFLDSIPKGAYVVARLVLDPPYDSSFAQYWKKDTLIYGKNKSLYHYLVKQGFKELDSLNKPRTFSFVFRKDDSISFKPTYRFSEGLFDRIHTSASPTTKDTSGWIYSPEFGPASQWKTLSWQATKDADTNSKGNALLQLYGIFASGQSTLLRTILPAEQTVDISGYNASQYPKMQLRMRSSDTAAAKPMQLNYWRLAFDPIADGALSARDYWKWNGDTISAYKDSLTLGIAFKNVSKYTLAATPFTLKMGDAAGKEITLQSGTLKALPAGDTTRIYFNGKTDTLLGKYYFKLDVNTNRTPVEQAYFNNSVYLPFKVDTLKAAVSLLNFKAQPSTNQVLATWTVAFEVKVKQYEILYGTDSTNMQTVLTQPAANTVAPSYQYSLAHTSPRIGKNYYRLKIVDSYGNTTITPAQEIIVMFTSYDVVPVGNSIEGRWTFQHEMKLTNYQWQHAWNGGTWNTISTVPAGNSGALQTSYLQKHLTPNVGKNNYRLMYTDAYGNSYLTVEKQVDIFLQSFTAEALGKTVQTNWVFSNEINIADYTLETGFDSTKMKTLATVVPTGNAPGYFTYSYLHTNPPLGYNYYRLKTRDKNGNIVYSPIHTVFIGDRTKVVVYPNPFNQELRIVTADNHTPWSLQLLDATGRVVIRQTGTGSVTLNTSLLPKGLYFLNYSKANQQIIQKLQKL